MKALTLTAIGGLEHLELQELPEPALTSPDEVLVRIRAAALNRMDLWVAEGLPGVRTSFPHVVGSDGAGVVEAVGAQVWPVSARATGSCSTRALLRTVRRRARQGGVALRDFAILGEHARDRGGVLVVVPAANLAPVPAEMSWPQAAAFSLATLTAWRMLYAGPRLRAGRDRAHLGHRWWGGAWRRCRSRCCSAPGSIVTSGSEAKLETPAGWERTTTLNHAHATTWSRKSGG